MTVAEAALLSGGMFTAGGRVRDGVTGVNSSHKERVTCGGPTGEGCARTGSLSGPGELHGGNIGDTNNDPAVIRSMERDGDDRIVKAGDGTGGESEVQGDILRGGVVVVVVTLFPTST